MNHEQIAQVMKDHGIRTQTMFYADPLLWPTINVENVWTRNGQRFSEWVPMTGWSRFEIFAWLGY